MGHELVRGLQEVAHEDCEMELLRVSPEQRLLGMEGLVHEPAARPDERRIGLQNNALVESRASREVSGHHAAIVRTAHSQLDHLGRRAVGVEGRLGVEEATRRLCIVEDESGPSEQTDGGDGSWLHPG